MWRRYAAGRCAVPLDAAKSAFSASGPPRRTIADVARDHPKLRAALPGLIDPAAPLDTARLFVAEKHTVSETRALHHHRGAFYAWSGSHYPDTEEAALRAELYRLPRRARHDRGKAVQAHAPPRRANHRRTQSGDVPARAGCRASLARPSLPLPAAGYHFVLARSRPRLRGGRYHFVRERTSRPSDPDAAAPHPELSLSQRNRFPL